MPHTVLVVDDDPLTQRVLQHYLERAGYRMLSANNGREAIKIARSALPQLIILDVMMPDMDGWTVLAQVQNTERTKAIPVIMLSGNADLMAIPAAGLQRWRSQESTEPAAGSEHRRRRSNSPTRHR